MEWRKIEILEMDYMLSEFGDLYSLSSGKLITGGKNQDGYHRFFFKRRKLGITKSMAKHRLVAQYFIGESSLEVNHIDGNKDNNHYSNLEWCSRSENIKHSFAIGLRTHKGINNPSHKRKHYGTSKSKQK